ncbi:competence protein ComFA [Desulfitispora alkaliphila]|uniref:DEAD/DEAH box helicase family protein n=1 Tax=Desulfitispora alkaliphila TaxID=622674 RepID=UPI003D1B1298
MKTVDNLCWKGYLYVAWGSRSATLALSPVPQVDLGYLKAAKGYHSLLCLTPELPLGQACYVFSQVSSKEAHKPIHYQVSSKSFSKKLLERFLGDFPATSSMGLLIKDLERRTKGALEQLGIEQELHQFQASESYSLELSQEGEYLDGLKELLEGRILLGAEVRQAISSRWLEQELSSFELKALLQLLYLKEELHIYPGIQYESQEGKACVRCGSTQKIVVATCFDCNSKSCSYCEECIAMGEVRLCRALYSVSATSSYGSSAEDADSFRAPIICQLGFPLTLAQKDAKEELERIQGEDRWQRALVWAVCGAGKTEVSYGVIEKILNRGGRVLFAIPRREVVVDLWPRLKSAFPQADVVALYGGCKDKYAKGQLVLATTHQTMRFYQCFDLVILDEVDAFPFRGSPMLYGAVERAKKPEGKVVYMSATPREDLIVEADRGEIGLVHIPARHHGHPVPEPQFLIGKHCQLVKGGKLSISHTLLEFIHSSVEGDLAQLFVFTPSIFLAEQVGKALKEATRLPPFNSFDGTWVEYSHSRDDNRGEKCRGFAHGQFPIFVTTTIVERGITVEKANVLVLFSGYSHIFDRGTLIQMAGRSGRSSKYPQGKVLFVADKVSQAMEEAVRDIRRQNNLARAKGYLVEENMWSEGGESSDVK